MSKKPLLAAVILAILAILLVIPADDTYTDEGDDDPQYRVPEKAEPRYPDLGTSLNRMVASVEAGQAVEKVTDNGAVHNAGMVAVSIYLSGETDGVVSFLEDNGGSPRNVGEDYIEAYVPATGDGEDIEITLPEKTELKYPNLGSRLDQLVAGVEHGEASTREAAEDAPVHQEESVAVTIYLSGNVDGVVSFLEDNGGSPRNVSEDYIEAYVPVPLLGQVSEQFGVLRVREIVPAEEHQSTQRIAGQGPQAHGSPAWNQAGYSGQGVKVGVIDSFFGFNDFSSLMGTELPSTVQARCYTDVGRFTQNVADCADALVGSAHGTWVAEAVMDIAPEASLYIVSPWSRGDTNSAVDWMVSQGVSVIVSAETSSFDGPGDGTSPFGDSPLRTVDRAVAGGIIWANAAGNYAQRTWFGPYSTVELGDSRFLKFDGSDIFNDMLLDAGDRIRVQLRWDDSWSGASRDFDLLVWDIDAADFVAYSYDLQGGRAGQVPSEELRYLVPSDGRYAVVVAHDSGGTPDWLQVTVRGVGSIEYYTESGSIGNPGESANPGMLAVGASPWYNSRIIEPFSSRGPTPDGRVKPDIVGADCWATALLPLNVHGDGFCGTSQSAAHVAGMAVLVRQGFPHLTAAQVASYLKDNAEQRGSPDPNNTWGHGFAKLPLTTPAVTCLTGGAVADTANNPGLAADCEVLLAAKDTLAGSATLDWSVSVPIDQWEGVTVGGTGRRVTGLNLGDKGLTGRIPAELGSLIYLENLFLTRNELTGIIPPGLGQLTNLGVLALGANQLTGPIPASLGSLASLQVLSLSQNQLTGPIPAELGSLTSLQVLYLWGNQLTGPIPAELGSLTSLQVLYLWGNQLTGPIPSALSTLTSLQELYLWGNQLTGPIPASLGSLTSLEVLSLSQNQLTGPIPASLGSLASLQVLSLSQNQLTGPIPAELGSLSNLEHLGFSQNQLTGPIPASLGSLASLQVLSLSQNQLTGPIPTWLGSLTSLQELYLSQNQLTGPIPSALSTLTSLQELYLWGNQLTGPIPASLGSLTSLEVLSLSQNQLTGPIPASLGSLSNLEHLGFSQNQLTGPIPASLGSLASLEHLGFSQNQLTGPIPAELGSLTSLQVLYLWGNQLTGPIPAELGSLTSLQVLYLWGNQLTGPIPSALSTLTSLQELYLWGNQLTGPIPSALSTLTNLEILALGENQLTGPIPAELGSLTSLQVLYLWGNQLTGPIPSALSTLTSLQELYLWGNQLTGPIPAELGSLTSLEVLSLSQNQLTGPIPASLGSLSNLEHLGFSQNQLTGPIPASLGSLASLQVLSLSQNQLTGPIPSELGSLSNLEELFLSGNQLTGCIPVGIAGVANNDLSQLGLPFCAGALGAPTIGTLTPGADFLTITWAAPTGSPESAIIAYDLRYIESAARDKSDVNWTVVDNAWTAGSGASSYQIAGLTDGTQYDVQVRAVTGAGDGPWSAAGAGTPATWGAIRSFSPPSVAPAGEVVVMITASGYGAFGQMVETLPPGFRYVSRSLSDSGVTAVGREVRFSLFGQTAFTYTVTAPSAAGTYSFSGVLRNSDRKDVAVGGALTIAVAAGDPLIVRYDANGNGMIERSEVIAAINDYLDGVAGITRSGVIRLINLYLDGPSTPPTPTEHRQD